MDLHVNELYTITDIVNLTNAVESNKCSLSFFDFIFQLSCYTAMPTCYTLNAKKDRMHVWLVSECFRRY